MLKTITRPRKFNDAQWIERISIRPKKILTSNSKLSLDGIWNFTLPAFNANVVIDGQLQTIRTCEGAGACVNFCYACGSCYTFDNSMIKHHRNLQYMISDPFNYVEQVVKEINSKRNLKFLRWHDSGDFIPMLWPLYKAIMERCPQIQFYAYTKMVSFIKNLYNEKQVPNNFSVIYSFGGIGDNQIDINIDKHSRIFKNRKDLRAAGYVEAYKSDKPAANPKNRKIGLIVHGSAVQMNIINKNKSIETMNKKIEQKKMVA